jgi:threonine synthase
MDYKLACTKCGHVEDDTRFRCKKCGAILEVQYKYAELKPGKVFKRSQNGTSRYVNLLPVKELVTLGEGGTPLRRILPKSMPDVRVLLKLETENPTKTFKDRGSALEISKALELHAKTVCCASTGNMGLSVAHYARHFGIKAVIFISKSASKAKIAKIRSQGARIAYVDGDFNGALNAAEVFASKTGAFMCGDYHFRKEGQKTVIYEIAEQTAGKMPDYLFVPVGNGTLLSGIYKGLKELKRYKAIRKIPRLVAVQSEMCDPLVNAYRNGKRIEHVRPRTAADAIAVGYPTFGFEVLAAIKGTRGSAVGVSEDELKDAVRLLEEYGVYSELGGGAGFAGFLRMYNQKNALFKGKKVAVIITGNNEGRFT